MCLIVLAYRYHPQYPLIVAANRDEYYRRSTVRAAFWPDHAEVLAGRDMEKMGTWMGITRKGRFAALTNYRDPAANKPEARSRGELVGDFLCGSDAPADYLRRVEQAGDYYNGFNILAGDVTGLFFCSNRSGAPAAVSPGIHGLSNHLLDTPWPKVTAAKGKMKKCLDSGTIDIEALFAILMDAEQAPDDLLPNTGVGLEWERLLSAAFIASPDYGTRSSTILLQDDAGKVLFIERGVWDQREVSFQFQISEDGRPG